MPNLKDNMGRSRRSPVMVETGKLLLAMSGAVIYAFGVNLFLVDSGFYAGGIMGLCQVIRTLLVRYAHLSFRFDIAGLIYYLLNIPILLFSMRRIGKKFFIRTIVCVTSMSLALSLIPIPVKPIMGEDVLASAVIGGLISGLGVGMTLTAGGSGGGMDVVGVLLVQWRRNFSVGKVNLIVNCFLYGICLFLFNVRIVIYSLIYAAFYSFAMDRMHEQNITVEVKIITKADTKELERRILDGFGRGITRWESSGAYTGEASHILYILLSKYELNALKSIVSHYDPGAFIVCNEGVKVQGNYLFKF